MSKKSNRRSKGKRARALLSLRAELVLLLSDYPDSLPLVEMLNAQRIRYALKYLTEKGRLPYYLISNLQDSMIQKMADDMDKAWLDVALT